MRQKYLPGYRVFINDLSENFSKSHFPHSIEAIVMGTYSQLYGGVNVRDYQLFLLDSQGLVRGTSAWYNEEDLNYVDNNIEENWRLVECYNFRDI